MAWTIAPLASNAETEGDVGPKAIASDVTAGRSSGDAVPRHGTPWIRPCNSVVRVGAWYRDDTFVPPVTNPLRDGW